MQGPPGYQGPQGPPGPPGPTGPPGSISLLNLILYWLLEPGPIILPPWWPNPPWPYPPSDASSLSPQAAEQLGGLFQGAYEGLLARLAADLQAGPTGPAAPLLEALARALQRRDGERR